jgi:hypothetical protein
MSPDSVLWHLPDAPSAERNLPPVALHDRPSVTRQLHYNHHLQFGTAYET